MRLRALSTLLVFFFCGRATASLAQPFDPFNVNTRDGVKCAALNDGGVALCVPGVDQGKRALSAFALWPTIPQLKAATVAAVKDAESQRAAAAAERAARLAREAEGVALRAALLAEQQRAGALERALNGSWWKTLLQYVVAPAGALGLGFGLGRLLR